MTPEGSAQLVTLHTYQFAHEATIAREVLEAEGITAFVPDEHTLSLNPGAGPAFGGARLQVRAEDIEKAREILDLAAPSSR